MMFCKQEERIRKEVAIYEQKLREMGLGDGPVENYNDGVDELGDKSFINKGRGRNVKGC